MNLLTFILGSQRSGNLNDQLFQTKHFIINIGLKFCSFYSYKLSDIPMSFWVFGRFRPFLLLTPKLLLNGLNAMLKS